MNIGCDHYRGHDITHRLRITDLGRISCHFTGWQAFLALYGGLVTQSKQDTWHYTSQRHMASYSGRRLCTSYGWVTLVYTLPLSAMRTVLGNGCTIRQPHPPIMYHKALKLALPKILLIENHHRHGHRPCLIQKTFLPMIQHLLFRPCRLIQQLDPGGEYDIRPLPSETIHL